MAMLRAVILGVLVISIGTVLIRVFSPLPSLAGRSRSTALQETD
jgi:hypothetical protein